MIQTRADYKEYLNLELERYFHGGTLKRKLQHFFMPPLAKWIYYLRTYEYLLNCDNVLFRKVRLGLIKYNFYKLSEVLGFSISPNTFDKGLKLQHYGGIIINKDCRIGKNCSIRPFTVIGNKDDKRYKEVPQIGDNVLIGANVVIIGGIKIGNNVVIGAGSVVLNSVPDNCVIAGNPAKILKTF
jgi:serine O-acetyltransferase